MRIEMRTAVLLMGLLVVAALAAPAIMADPGKGKPKLTIECNAPNGSVAVDNVAGTATPAGNCTVNGNATGISFTNNSDIDIKIIAATGVDVVITILDDVGNNKYKVDGAESNDSLTYTDDIGNDKLDFKGKAGTNALTVNDDAGNDQYEAKDTSLTATDGDGKDKYEGKDISIFSFTDSGDDMDKIEVMTS